MDESLVDQQFSVVFHSVYGKRLRKKNTFTAAGVVQCRGPKKPPRASSIVQIIF